LRLSQPELLLLERRACSEGRELKSIGEPVGLHPAAVRDVTHNSGMKLTVDPEAMKGR
jgi:hypothetical protein